MSDTAPQMLASFFRRWSDMEDRKAEIADEGKEMSAEMKSAGLDSKAIRAVFRDKRKEINSDPAEMQEAEAIYSLYWSALTNALSEPRAHPAPAHVEIIEQFDPETGEITQPETANQSGLTEGTLSDAGHSSDAGTSEQLGSEYAGTSSDENPALHSHSEAPTSSQAATEQTGEAFTPPPASPVAPSDDGIPSFLKTDKPDCLKLKDGHCKIGFPTDALCAECADRRAKVLA